MIPVNSPPKSITRKRQSCNSCSNKGNLVDIEDSSSNKREFSNNNSSNNNNNGDRKIIIEQKVSKDQPLSECLNNISNSLQYLSNEQLPQTKQLLESLNNGKTTTTLVCVCQQSSNLPFCDSSHDKFNKETNSNIQPIYLTLDNNSNIDNNINNSNNNDEKKQPQVKKIIDTTKIIEKEKEKEKEKEIITPIVSKYKPGKLNDPINQNNWFSLEEIAKHNSMDSCWMIIHNKVYDITKYIIPHPGGINALLRFAGKDGTENVQFHSPKMLQILNNHYFIGHLQKDQQTIEPSRCTIV
ncbi:hypothetical protein ACTA71_009470 [Dictyostelium dimigraforme]